MSDCCENHTRNCEPQTELCCARCPEVHHGVHICPGFGPLRPLTVGGGSSPSHHRGQALFETPCVLDAPAEHERNRG